MPKEGWARPRGHPSFGMTTKKTLRSVFLWRKSFVLVHFSAIPTKTLRSVFSWRESLNIKELVMALFYKIPGEYREPARLKQHLQKTQLLGKSTITGDSLEQTIYCAVIKRPNFLLCWDLYQWKVHSFKHNSIYFGYICIYTRALAWLGAKQVESSGPSSISATSRKARRSFIQDQGNICRLARPPRYNYHKILTIKRRLK